LRGCCDNFKTCRGDVNSSSDILVERDTGGIAGDVGRLHQIKAGRVVVGGACCRFLAVSLLDTDSGSGSAGGHNITADPAACHRPETMYFFHQHHACTTPALYYQLASCDKFRRLNARWFLAWSEYYRLTPVSTGSLSTLQDTEFDTVPASEFSWMRY
jgi:hypothetical protein